MVEDRWDGVVRVQCSDEDGYMSCSVTDPDGGAGDVKIDELTSRGNHERYASTMRARNDHLITFPKGDGQCRLVNNGGVREMVCKPDPANVR
jgi:hypothetical protein